MWALALLPFTPLLVVGIFAALRTPLVGKIFGRERIYIKGLGSAINGECWYASLMTDPTGERHAYRYPVTRIGRVTLNDDGTGYYCGPVRWVSA